ncbi:MAG: 30S ribosomal protein S20 [Parcubacteria group bacterium GW2011_GWA1_53_13]|nr:MAG: 30S ribosomal protein S20 [Parcubacteria group bacterium GW2011_GWA2_49_16]KKW33597.1 MAG: 30S ribosomal protein S20 [Parcubacteria group bacterium GW2011_GWA1_53_13]
MAITTSAKKAHRAGLRKKAFNDARKKNLSLALKGVRNAQKGDTKAIAAAYQAIDKAMKRGLMTKNTAARRKAKVAKALATSH